MSLGVCEWDHITCVAFDDNRKLLNSPRVPIKPM
jgi:hypothetical protein